MSLTINVDTAALDRLMDGLADDVGEAIRPAAQAAAQVLYQEVNRNVDKIGKVTGNLKSSIYQVYSRDHSINGERAIYHVSWNASKAPHGHLVEYGHVQRYQTYVGKDGKWHTNKAKKLASPRQVGARPFVRPAMSKFDEAMEAAKAELLRRIDEKTQ